MCCTASLRSRSSSRFHRGFTCFEIQDFNKRERLRVLIGKLKKSAGCTWNLIQATPSYTICPSVFCVSEKSAAEVCDVRTPYAPHLLELWLPALTVPLDAAWTSYFLMFMTHWCSLYVYQSTCYTVGWSGDMLGIFKRDCAVSCASAISWRCTVKERETRVLKDWKALIGGPEQLQV